ncbi:hypothetical protein NM208_g8449 [Fusarium decemcellulare]|uniref:Uncharacterized protein n=1 Tax=Fusarium decemcellulare TaxID=57161 RepID=A0ACC1S5E6_9HYPO|nr:hypothetical protein NM208_g8449 [Fusarium decemcellulare]
MTPSQDDSNLSARESRVIGALLGVHSGDSLGATVEFKPHTTIARDYPNERLEYQKSTEIWPLEQEPLALEAGSDETSDASENDPHEQCSRYDIEQFSARLAVYRENREETSTSLPDDPLSLLPQEVVLKMQQWIKTSESKTIWVQGLPSMPQNSVVSHAAARICIISIQTGLPCVSFFCQPRYSFANDKKLTQKEAGLVALLYTVVSQLACLLPEAFPETDGLNEGRFNLLDGTMESTPVALDLIRALLTHAPSSLIWVMDGLQLVESNTTIPHLRAFLEILREQETKRVSKACFTTQGNCFVLTRAIDVKERVDASRIALNRPGAILRGGNAARGITDDELDISTAPVDELFVVVGELLQKNYFQDLQYTKFRDSATFDPSRHTTVGPTEGNFIVVRPVSFEKSVMYLLHDKGDGASSIAPLPAGYETLIVYYHEWTTGFGHRHKTERNDGYRNNLSAFCHEFMTQHFPGLVQSEQEGQETDTEVDDSMGTQEDAGAQTEETPVNTSALLFPEIQDSFAKFEASGERAWLLLAIKRLDAMCGNEFSNDLNVKGHLRMKVRTMLFSPEEFEMKDAEDLVRLAKEEWYKTPPVTPYLEAPIIYRLVRGLRHGALRGVSVPPAAWRILITQFCNNWATSPCEDPDSLKRLIETIHTSLMQFGCLALEPQVSQ